VYRLSVLEIGPGGDGGFDLNRISGGINMSTKISNSRFMSYMISYWILQL
jgi:hypothetical protein